MLIACHQLPRAIVIVRFPPNWITLGLVGIICILPTRMTSPSPLIVHFRGMPVVQQVAYNKVFIGRCRAEMSAGQVGTAPATVYSRSWMNTLVFYVIFSTQHSLYRYWRPHISTPDPKVSNIILCLYIARMDHPSSLRLMILLDYVIAEITSINSAYATWLDLFPITLAYRNSPFDPGWIHLCSMISNQLPAPLPSPTAT